MNRALTELNIEGIKTNRNLQKWIINEKTFRSGIFGTSYYEKIAKEAENAL
jgi:biotin carboxylase